MWAPPQASAGFSFEGVIGGGPHDIALDAVRVVCAPAPLPPPPPPPPPPPSPPPPLPTSVGCTYEAAKNYDPSAAADDGSCDFTVDESPRGCVYSAAANFDPGATVDDGSCVFEAPLGCFDSNGRLDDGDFNRCALAAS